MYITKVDGKIIERRELNKRECTLYDLDMLVKFQEEVNEYNTLKNIFGSYSYDELLRIINTENAFCYLYYDDNVFVGFLLIDNAVASEEYEEYEIKHIDRCKTAIYAAVMINPKYWGNGLQRQISKEAEDTIANKGYKYIVITVSPINVYSYNNFKQLEYKIISEKDLSFGHRYIMYKEV